MEFWLYWLIGLVISVYLSIWIIRKNRDLGYTFLVVLSTGYILIANILTPRLINLNIGFGGLTCPKIALHSNNYKKCTSYD